VPPREVVRDLHSPDLEAICLKALTKDRSQRYEAALDMAQDLERFLRGEPVAARVTRGAREAVPTARKASSTYFLVAVLAVEAAVIAALVGRIFGWW
jgi:serine/threonine-protein kinase